MSKLILYWWAIPLSIVLIVFRLMIWHDGLNLSEVRPWAMSIMVVLSVVWPLGVLVIVVIISEAYMKRWGWIR